MNSISKTHKIPIRVIKREKPKTSISKKIMTLAVMLSIPYISYMSYKHNDNTNNITNNNSSEIIQDQEKEIILDQETSPNIFTIEFVKEQANLVSKDYSLLCQVIKTNQVLFNEFIIKNPNPNIVLPNNAQEIIEENKDSCNVTIEEKDYSTLSELKLIEESIRLLNAEQIILTALLNQLNNRYLYLTEGTEEYLKNIDDTALYGEMLNKSNLRLMYAEQLHNEKNKITPREI